MIRYGFDMYFTMAFCHFFDVDLPRNLSLVDGISSRRLQSNAGLTAKTPRGGSA